MWGAVGSLSPVFAGLLVCFPLCVFSGLLCGFLMPLAAQEVSVAGGKKNIVLEGFFLLCELFFFFLVEVGHSRGDRVRASLPGYCIPLPW